MIAGSRPLRVALVPLVLATVLAACGGSDEEPVEDSSAAPTDVTDEALEGGAVSVPGTVVALDDFAALAALSLGVTPDLALDTFGYESTVAVLQAEGVGTQPYGAELNLEAVAAADPDVIIGVSLPTTVGVQDQLDAIATTTIVEYTATWQDQLRDVGTALGVPDRADELIARVEEQSADLATDLEDAGLAGDTVSILADLDGLFSPPLDTGVGSVLEGVGLDRPEAQKAPTQADAPFLQFSEEELPAQDADHIVILSGGAYRTEGLTGSPLWGTLAGVQSGDVHEVSAEVWFSSSAFGTSWVLDDLRRILLDETEPKVPADAAEQFAQFTEIAG